MKIIKIKDISIAFGVEWKDIDGSNSKSIQSSIKKAVLTKDRQYVYATFLDLYKVYKKTIYAFSENTYFEKENVYPAVSFFINNFKSYVIVKKVEELKENNIKKIIYWFCAIDSNGFVVEDSLVNEDAIDLKVSEYLEIDYNLACFKNDYQPYSPEITINKIFNEDLFDEYFELVKNSKFTRYKKEELKLNHNLIIIGVIAALGLGGFFTYYDTGTKKEIVKTDYLRKFKEERREMTSWEQTNNLSTNNRNNKNEIIYTEEEIEDFAKKQIQQKFDLQKYNNTVILENIILLERTYPIYLAEWRIEKVAYSSNKFILIYSKLSDSNGVFTDLDYMVGAISKDKTFKVIPAALEKNATIRIFEIEFNNYERVNSENLNLTLFDIRNQQKEKIEEIIKDIKVTENKIKSFKNRAGKINTFKQIFSNDLTSIKSNLSISTKKLNELYANLKIEINFQPENYDMNRQISSNSGLQYLKMSQIHTNFDWGFPTNKISYPVLDRKNKNMIPYANSYDVSVKSKKEISNNFEDMLLAGKHFSNQNIIIDKVDYEIHTGNWTITGIVFEKIK